VDALTGVANRQWLLAQARQAVALATWHKAPLAVLFVDINGFRHINTAVGTLGGDGLLRVVARQLCGAVRASDIVGRLGGDTFAVVLPCCDGARAADVAARIQARLSVPCAIGDATITPAVRIGASLWPTDANAFDVLLQQADVALRQARTAACSQVQVQDAGSDASALAGRSLEWALRDAVRQGQLQLHYQPQVNLAGEGVYGVEALARWHHPLWGDISPARFIPLAESCGLIDELGQWAVREACRQLGEWRRRGVGVPSVSVNLSPTSFRDRALPGLIAQALQQHALTPDALRLEITESVLLDRGPGTLHTIRALHAQGVRLSIDDFGTGYSSLGYLRQLPLSEIKLDKSLVDDLEHDATSRALSQAVLNIGKSLQLTVVAEGVEGERQQGVLKAQGYQVAQGYLFARALPAAMLEHWLNDFSTGRAGLD
jgi:diguanylate cyclase (GGDEF)-like protein